MKTRGFRSSLAQHMLHGTCDCCAGRKEKASAVREGKAFAVRKEKGSAVRVMAPAAEPQFLRATLAVLQRGTPRSAEPAGTITPPATTWTAALR
jgi:hypothetical protein